MEQKSDVFIKIYDYIAAGRLMSAFDELESAADSVHEYDKKDEVGKIRETYHWMLDYMSKGIADPERMKVYRNIKCQCYELADYLNETRKSINSHNFVYTQKQYLSDDMLNHSWNISSAITDLEKLKTKDVALIVDKYAETNYQGRALAFVHEKLSKRIFDYFFLLGGDVADLKRIFDNDLIDIDDKCLTVSAMTLFLMRKFDLSKAILLTSLCERNEDEIAERALVGLLPLIAKYADRLDDMVSWKDRIYMVFDSIGTRNAVKRVIMQYIRTNETEKLVKQLKDEIIPEMRKLSDDIVNSDINDEGEVVNPQWQEKLEQSGIADKLRKYSDLQQEGSDVYMGTFAMLKTFPFFSCIANWFRPYNPNLSDIMDLFSGDNEAGMEDFFSSIMDVGSMCDSDRFSFSLALMHMPEEQRKAIADAFVSDRQQELELREDDEILSKIRKSDLISNSYIQDLYRFYRLFTAKDSFESPFDYSAKLQESVILDLAGLDVSDRIEIAEYCLSKELYRAAFNLFSSIDFPAPAADCFQKLGYCCQKLGNFVEAIKYYNQAEVIEPDDVWTILRLAYCYKVTADFKSAAAYYSKAEVLQPDATSISLKRALCQLECGMETEALATFFKIDYETQGDVKLWRIMAMTCFSLSKLSQAEKYSSKVLSSDKAEWGDYVTGAYLKLVKNDISGAIDSIRTAKEKAGGVLKLITDRFASDSDMLNKSGLDTNLLPLLFDAAFSI